MARRQIRQKNNLQIRPHRTILQIRRRNAQKRLPLRLPLRPRKNAQTKNQRRRMFMPTNNPKCTTKKMETNVHSKRRSRNSQTKNKHARPRPSIPRPSHVQNIRPPTPQNQNQIPSIPINGILMGNRRPHSRNNPRPQRHRTSHVNSSPRIHPKNLQLAKPRINLQRTLRNRRSKNLKIKRRPRSQIRNIPRLERPKNMVNPIPP